MQREVNQASKSRPVHDTERFRRADHTTRPVGSNPGTRVSASYELEPEITGADILREAGVAPARGPLPNTPVRKQRAR